MFRFPLLLIIFLVPITGFTAGISWLNVSHTGGVQVRENSSWNSRYFEYAPSAFLEGNYRYIFYCGNNQSGQIKDSIRLNKIGNQFKVTAFYFDKDVINTNGFGWDSKHICDPSVIKGKFRYDNVNYKYAMFYTGSNDPYNNGTHNQIGLAFSNNLENWVKRPNPIIYKNCSGSNCWGVGQPSVTSVDGKGQLLLFMTRGTPYETKMTVTHLDLSNLDTSIKTLKNEWNLTTNGLGLGINGKSYHLAGADLLYDNDSDTFYMVWGSRFDEKMPNWISTELMVSSLKGSSMWSGYGAWTNLGTYQAEQERGRYQSKKAKTFDAGFDKNPYGNLPYKGSPLLMLNYSVSDSVGWPNSLWTYNIRRAFGYIF